MTGIEQWVNAELNTIFNRNDDPLAVNDDPWRPTMPGRPHWTNPCTVCGNCVCHNNGGGSQNPCCIDCTH